MAARKVVRAKTATAKTATAKAPTSRSATKKKDPGRQDAPRKATVAKAGPSAPARLTGAANFELPTGARAPGFRLRDDAGVEVALDDFAGRRVVLFFFQKAATPGCTVEACEFRDTLPQLDAAGVTVLGIAPDGWKRLGKFRAAQRLPYRLLSDREAAVARAYGVWREKLFWGQRYLGVLRSTFVIGPKGRLEHAWYDAHHEGHAGTVLAWLRGEPAPPLPKAAALHELKKANAAARAAR